ncbi:MAG: peptidylprolyl isomerase [Oscillospiraceae bacterium]|nr:peptidylprolyl isomerase [Oscillospiraceae bacterium]
MNFKKTMIWAAAAMMLASVTACGDKNDIADSGAAIDNGSGAASVSEAEDAAIGENTFIITLYPDIAPISCENFEKLVNDGFYNGLTFHRVIDDFMAQGGDPQGTGMGGSENSIKGEFESNGVTNTLSHQRGVVSMARSSDPDSASSQFFICYTDDSFLDGNYAAFGEVTEGMEVVDNFLKVERAISSSGEQSVPTTPIVMDKVEMISDDENGNPRVQVIMQEFLK